MSSLADYFGPASILWLHEIGIITLTDLQNIGIEEAFRQMVLRGFPVNASMLYGLDGALEGKKWHELSSSRKSELKKMAAVIKKRVMA